MKHPNHMLYDAEPFINPQTIMSYANTNEPHLKTPVKGIIVELPGLGGSSCLGGSINRGVYESEFAVRCGELGIILAYIFPGPWSWGSKAAIRITDAVITAIAKKHDLGESFPLVVSGGSMGGLGSLMFACDTAHDIAACVAACPCIDVLDRLDSHPDFPRTFVSAVAGYDMPLTDALKAISPIERIADLPKIPYFICSDEQDEVFPEAQCDAYIEKLKEAGHDVIYFRQPGMMHGGFLPEVIAQLREFQIKHILG